MISYSIIQKSQLEGAHRLDAEYYQPEYLILNSKIKSQKAKLLKELADKVFSGPFGSTLKSESYQMQGVPFIRIGDISDVFIEQKDLVYISEAEHKRIFSTHLDPGDIVFSKIGTIGRLSVISEDLGQVNISENNIGIRLSKLSPQEKVSLLLFLLSENGQLQILRSASGNIQQKLNVADIENVKIPVFSAQFQQELLNLYEEITKLRKQSESLYSQAEDLLLEELGLKDFEIEDDLSYIVNLSEVKSAHRADAEYFQPKYEKLVQVVARKFDIQELKQVFSFKRGIFVSTKYYTEGKTNRPYIRIKELSGGKSGIDESKVVFIDERYPEDKNNILKENDLVIAIIGDTIGKVNKINKELANGFCSNNMGRLRIKSEWSAKIIPEFSEVLFQSIFIQSQVERKKAQTGQPKIGDNEIKSIKIPILPKPAQQKIADLLQKSHNARSKAKQLLEQAKRKVESLMEK